MTKSNENKTNIWWRYVMLLMPRGCTDARCVGAAATGVERCGRVLATGTGGGTGAGGRAATSGTKVRWKPWTLWLWVDVIGPQTTKLLKLVEVLSLSASQNSNDIKHHCYILYSCHLAAICYLYCYLYQHDFSILFHICSCSNAVSTFNTLSHHTLPSDQNRLSSTNMRKLKCEAAWFLMLHAVNVLFYQCGWLVW